MKTRIASLFARSRAALALLALTWVAIAAGPPLRAGSAEQGDPCDNGQIIGSERTVVHGNIVHYTYDVRVGPGQFDVIRLHRIVKEQFPGSPVPTIDAVLMLPGSPNSFEMIFMASALSPALRWDDSISVYLAKHNVDVWGMDYAWVLVPGNTTNFGFMQDWGLDREIQHTNIALTLAQEIRVQTGQGCGRMNLLGFSYGVPIVYAVAGEETQGAHDARKVKGLIPVDFLIKTDDEAWRLNSCKAAASNQARLNAGIYQLTSGASLKAFATLAETSPDAPSPVVPAYTNRQFYLSALTTGAFWHFSGGDIEQLLFTDLQVYFDTAPAIPSFTPVHAQLDLGLAACDTVDVPFDDHLGEITVPIFYLGAAGGVGNRGLYSVSLTGSTDVTIHIVQELGDDMRAMDFGHADLFLGEDAELLAWKPVLKWIQAHAGPPSR